MKTIHHATSHPPHEAHQPSIMCRIVAWLTGTSIDALVRAPDDERKTVYAMALVLVLFGGWIILAVVVFMGIVVGDFFLRGLIASVVFAGLILLFDQSMLRDHWVNTARKIAARERLPTEATAGWRTLAVKWGGRVVLALVWGLTLGSIIMLAMFRHDIDAQIADQNQKDNRPLVAEVEARVDGEIAAAQSEIERLDTEKADILDMDRVATTPQIESLNTERAAVQARIVDLTQKLDCQTQNLLAEETGQIRCDDMKTVPGMGRRYQFASRMAESFRTGLDEAKDRLQEIERTLMRLSQIPDAAQTRLNQIEVARKEAMTVLASQRQDRDSNVLTIVHSDAKFIPMPDGLLVRGEALFALLQKSAWMRVQYSLISLTLTLVEVLALLFFLTRPVPIFLVHAEASLKLGMIANETAHAEQMMTTAAQPTLDARARRFELEEEFAKRSMKSRSARQAYQGVEEAIKTMRN